MSLSNIRKCYRHGCELQRSLDIRTIVIIIIDLFSQMQHDETVKNKIICTHTLK